ncbi:MAG: polysaccharide biosynthesis tyrosine autokinase [Halomonas sp.]|nr:polysaccharide biosynthesis tyrosine autokinase [Halomonas sp.]
MSNTPPATSSPQQDSGVDLSYILGTFWDHKFLVITLTVLAGLIGAGYAFVATPVYRADALVQVESKNGGMAGDELAGLLGEQEPQTSAHIEILSSRMVLGQAVDQENLDIQAQPRALPVLGDALARRGIPRPDFAQEWGYAWGNEQIQVASLSVAPERLGEPLTLRVLSEERYALFDSAGQKLGEGQVGEAFKVDDAWVELRVSELQAPTGAEFILAKTSRLAATRNLQSRFSVSQRGKESGILELNLTGTDPQQIVESLDAISQIYLTQNIARQAAEAENSLAFLEKQVPNLREQLNEAENRLNEYRSSQDSVDLTIETQNALNSLVELESQINELELVQSELSRRFTPNHPQYQALLEKKEQLLREKELLEARVDDLPETQQEILRLTREVEVTQQIYVQLLNRMQELNIAKAGTVGNVRILDDAVIQGMIAPRTLRIIAVSLVGGFLLAVCIVLLRLVFNRGVETPDQIEALGLPVYATVPLSEEQDKLNRRVKRSGGKGRTIPVGLLAERNPADTSIEALRGLRTSLHFAMMEGDDNRLMITGPSPGIGKSFISVNLAAVCAQAGMRVLVIDGDMRKGHIHSVFGARSEGGLSEVLSGRLALDEVIQPGGSLEGLHYISRGVAPPNPSELLASARFTDLLDTVAQRYDLVIIDSPPILAVTDAAIIGKQVGTSLMVARFQLNPAKEIELAMRRLETAGVSVKGGILNALERKAATAYGYGYYNYSYK